MLRNCNKNQPKNILTDSIPKVHVLFDLKTQNYVQASLVNNTIFITPLRFALVFEIFF